MKETQLLINVVIALNNFLYYPAYVKPVGAFLIRLHTIISVTANEQASLFRNL